MSVTVIRYRTRIDALLNSFFAPDDDPNKIDAWELYEKLEDFAAKFPERAKDLAGIREWAQDLVDGSLSARDNF